MRSRFKVLHTDAHSMEPPPMWSAYIDPSFADTAAGPFGLAARH